LRIRVVKERFSVRVRVVVGDGRVFGRVSLLLVRLGVEALLFVFASGGWVVLLLAVGAFVEAAVVVVVAVVVVIEILVVEVLLEVAVFLVGRGAFGVGRDRG
jgi:hypothetical protein